MKKYKVVFSLDYEVEAETKNDAIIEAEERVVREFENLIFEVNCEEIVYIDEELEKRKKAVEDWARNPHNF